MFAHRIDQFKQSDLFSLLYDIQFEPQFNKRNLLLTCEWDLAYPRNQQPCKP